MEYTSGLARMLFRSGNCLGAVLGLLASCKQVLVVKGLRSTPGSALLRFKHNGIERREWFGGESYDSNIDSKIHARPLLPHYLHDYNFIDPEDVVGEIGIPA